MRTKADMHGYQDRVTTQLYERAALQAVLPMGGGKTVCALTAIDELIEDGEIKCALGLAPKKVAQLVWPNEPAQWGHLQHMRVVHVTGTPKKRLELLLGTDADVYVVGVDNTQWLVEVLASLPADHKLFGLLFIDELSRFKNPTGKRAKALQKIIKRWPAVWGLTGTPRPNGYEDQFRPLSLLTKNAIWGKSFHKWRRERFMPLDYNGYNWALRPEWRERTIEDIKSVSITISDDDMPDLPELSTIIHWVELPPAARRLYKGMEKKLLSGFDSRNIMAANRAIAQGKLAQLAQGFMYGDGNEDVEHVHTAKADLLAELLEDLNDDPALIGYEFVEDLRVLRELYGPLPYLGSGVSDALTAQYEKQWNARQLPKMAIHPASAGHGLNLQFGGRYLFWYGVTWSAELYDQTLKRFHRPGQQQRCFSHLILARDTVDEIKHDRVVMKMTEQEAFRRYLDKA